jgi:HD-GYP domain-containing protein (c-di-GMP phosphodiesterase class II)
MNAYFDRRYGYRRRSMLVLPLLDQLDRVLGLLMLVNRKTDANAKITTKAIADRYVIEYASREIRLARILASLAAAAIENAKLYVQIETTLESFVEASMSAIDLRDPATAGHSLRVAMLVTGLAEAVDHKKGGPYGDVHFTPRQLRELRFAALVHDFGKIAVREDVLLKEKKLPPRLWERIDARFELIARIMEVESCTTGNGTRGAADETLAERLKEVERCREVVRAANEPVVLDARTAAELRAIARCEYQRSDGTMAPYLTEEELHFLLLREGTLDEAERAEVESHAAATHRYLANVPWTDDLRNLVAFASDHHELLNGEGYPRHLKADEIALQTRIITMIDMFDALTATDRPYRHAATPDRALEMLRGEAARGRLDSDLVEILAESEVYRRTPAAK